MRFLLTIAVVCYLAAGRFSAGMALFGGSRRADKLRAQTAERAQALLDSRGMPPLDDLVEHEKYRDETLTAVAADAARGEWASAARYLAAARGHEARFVAVGQLANIAAEDDGWLQNWRRAEPDSVDAATVHADGLVKLAWLIRSGLRAEYVTQEQFQGFFGVLENAAEAGPAAIALAPDDPTPWAVQVMLAVGQQWSNDDFASLWREIVARDPHHVGAHVGGLQYWCDKWHGNHESMFGFARAAAAGAPRGSLLAMLPVAAHHEYLFQEELASNDYYPRPEVQRDVDHLLAVLPHVAPDDPWLPRAYCYAAHALLWGNRDAEALDCFAAAGRHVTGPYRYALDPRQGFAKARMLAASAVVTSG